MRLRCPRPVVVTAHARMTSTHSASTIYRETGAIPYREAITALDDFRASIEGDRCNMGSARAEQHLGPRTAAADGPPGEPARPWRFAWDLTRWARVCAGSPRTSWTPSGPPPRSRPWSSFRGRAWRAEHGADYDGLAVSHYLAVPETSPTGARLIFGVRTRPARSG